MAGSGRFPGWQVPIPMPGWQAGRPPAYPEDDHRARPIVLGNHVEAVFEGRRIVMIPECELRMMLPRMISQRADLRTQAVHLRAELDVALLTGWVPHETEDCHVRRRADQMERLLVMVDSETRLAQAIIHSVQRLLILNPRAVIYGPYP